MDRDMGHSRGRFLFLADRRTDLSFSGAPHLSAEIER